ncbi:MAG: Flp pilus assembly complex ATPase component TadA [Candidatus Iainarchaeum archaeon]|uniref:Flp pilus assembly complex ATPase component TadA n=1 Tax=Candidatus Iainarchaeum sp. TaxID=3101447 RepID=A0A7T9DJU0_9ARCH|nr:MAG: Flp pilus assembly complex ATPase component TadA [Candidatus Diapherotrites archaeon]
MAEELRSKDYLKGLIEAAPKATSAAKPSSTQPPIPAPMATTAPRSTPTTPVSAAPASVAPPRSAVADIPSAAPQVGMREDEMNALVQKLSQLRGMSAPVAPTPATTPRPSPAAPAPMRPAAAQPIPTTMAKSPEPSKSPTDFSKVVQDLKTLAQEKDTPSFESVMETRPKTLLEEYGKAKIYRVQNESLLYYYVPVARPTVSERAIINTLKEVATRLITITPYKIRDPEQKRTVYRQQVLDILRASPEMKVPPTKYEFYAEAVVSEMVGYGLIDDLIKDDRLEEIMVIGPRVPVYVFHRKYDMMITNIQFTTDDEIEDVINRIAREVGRRVDISSPLLDARLLDGSRVNATIPPASVSGSTLTIRKFRADPISMVDLITYKTLTPQAAAFLWMCSDGMKAQPANMLISGGTSSGKTTLLNVLCSFIPANERVISIEDTSELSLPITHWIRLEGRPPGLEGKGELTLDILTKNSLRMRPDRIIVGEVRHNEAFSLFTAMNTGHDGSMGTVHANSAEETLIRVTSPPMEVPSVMLSGLNFVVVANIFHSSTKGSYRRVTEIAEVTGVLQGKPSTNAIFTWDPIKDELIRTNVPVHYLERLSQLTGKSKDEIEVEINRRERFLQGLVERKVRDLKTVSQLTQQFVEESA